MTYRRKPLTEPLNSYVEKEFEEIEKEFSLFNYITLKELYEEPTRPRDGLTVFADGTTWNPGSGRGVYTYYGAAWHKLG